MTDTTSTNIDELVNAPIVETTASEDFIVINHEKAIKQITLGQLMSKVIDLIPIANTEFPGSLNLDTLLKAITYKLFHLSTSDIVYDGEINMEYGNLKEILIFILDKLNGYENGISSSKITYTPSVDTPEHAADIEDYSIEGMINYVLNNYRYGNISISSEDVSVDLSTWSKNDLPDGTTETDLQTAFDNMYQVMIHKSDKTKKIYASTQEDIEFSSGVIANIAELNIKAIMNTMLDITTCFNITCNVPGVLSILVYNDGVLIDSFEDALTTGVHTINQFTFASLKLEENKNVFLLTTDAIFTPDDNTGDILVPAVIERGKMRLLYQGYDISYYKVVEEGV